MDLDCSWFSLLSCLSHCCNEDRANYHTHVYSEESESLYQQPCFYYPERAHAQEVK